MEQQDTLKKGVKAPRIVAIGGGKGGVGKSLISAGIATSLARAGYKTVCIDLDLGGANLQTFLGLRHTESGIGDFIYRQKGRPLSEFCSACSVNNLKLVSGNGAPPGIANLYYFQKMKVIRAIRALEADYVVMDLGAGTSYNVVDFFSITRKGLVVMNPEPTSILNGYEFIKNVLFRVFARSFKKGSPALDIIEAYKFGSEDEKEGSVSSMIEEFERYDREAAGKIRRLCQEFHPGVVMNMATSSKQARLLAANLASICRRFLSIEISYAGMVPADPVVKGSLIRLENLVEHHPESQAARAIMALAEECTREHFVSGGDLDSEDQKAEAGVVGLDPDADKGPADKSDEVAVLLEQFFQVLKQESHQDISSGTIQEEASDPMDPWLFLELHPRSEPHWFQPMFYKERRYQGDEIEIPDQPSKALSLIVALSDLEEGLKEDGSGSQAGDRGPFIADLADAWFDCGCLFLKGGQIPSAARAFSKAHQLRLGDLMTASNMAACNILLGNLAEAARLLKRLVEEDGGSALRPLFNLGLCMFLEGDHKGASGVLSRLANHPDTGPPVLGLLSEALFHAGKSEDGLKALDLLSRHVNRDSKRADEIQGLILFNKALMFIRLRRFEEAARCLESLLKAVPLDGQAHAALGLCLIHLGEPERAERHLSRAVSLRPADLGLRAARASLLFSRQILDKAIEDAEVIARLRPGNPGYRQLIEAIRTAI